MKKKKIPHLDKMPVILPTCVRKAGFISRKLLILLIGAGVVGGAVYWGVSFFLEEEEELLLQNYHVTEKADFLVTVKLTGKLAFTDVVTLKCELEGETTIRSIIDEGTEVKGNTTYEIQAGDTLASIAEAKDKNSLAIQILNEDLEIDWDNLPPGKKIEIPGDLLVELAPLKLRDRIQSQEIVVNKAKSALNRAKGDMATLNLSTTLDMKIAENGLQNAEMDLDKARNSTVKNHVQNLEGTIANLEKDVVLAEKKLQAYTKLEELGFVSPVEVMQEESSKAKTLHNIEMAKADLEAYLKYDQVSLLSVKELAVDEAKVNIKKTKVKNNADLSDANSTVYTAEKTLALQKEKLEDLLQQMGKTKIYAPSDGTVVFIQGRYDDFGPIMDGAKVHNGRKLMKLPKTKSLKVELDVPQAKLTQLKKGMEAWVQVDMQEEKPLKGTLSVLATTVDTSHRRHSDNVYFKGEITFDDTDKLPDTASEGMEVMVEIQVINLEGDNQRIKLPNHCVTTRMISEDNPQTGCWVLNRETEKHEWRPVRIEYSDETYIAIREESDPNWGLREGELVHLSPLTEAENLNLEERITGKEPFDPKEEPASTDKEKAALNAKQGKKEEDAVAGSGG